MIGIIYEHRNKLNGKRYVGQTIQELGARLRQGYNNTKFSNALKKYGWENFETSLLWELESEDREDLIESLNIIEEIIVLRDNLQDDNFGYNTKAGGKNGSFKHTPEAIEKIRIAGRKPNKGHFQKGYTPWIKGRSIKPTEEHKRKVSEGLVRAYANGTRNSWNKGKNLSVEHKEKISRALKGRYVSKYPTHVRWHEMRNLTNINCSFCKGEK